MPSHEREHALAIDAVRRAARICRSVQSKIDRSTLEKRDKSPVTVADYASQALVCSLIAEAFPEDPVIAEEDTADLRSEQGQPIFERVCAELAGELQDPEQILRGIDRGSAASGQGRRWALDPVDGTKGFLRGEQYAIALALLVDERLEVAAVACPNLPLSAHDADVGVVFSAVRGGGAFVEPLFSTCPRTSIRVSAEREPARMRVCESVEAAHSAHDASAAVLQKLGVAAPPVRLDSQAKYGVVARGDAELYLRLPTRADYREKIWDHAGGCLIVLEAGGKVTDVSGKSLDFTQGRQLTNNRGVVVSHGPLHDEIVAALVEAGVR